ncbi:MAG: 5'-nucleotidase C-terminal domain-containing protein [Thermotaleaceae bacterium]
METSIPKRKLFKSFTALFLALVMVLGLVPVKFFEAKDSYASTITIAEWNFNDGNTIVDDGIPANLGREITWDTGSTATYPTDTSISNTNWGAGKNWQISFTTAGYDNITLSSKQKSSNTGPRDFKVQYSLNGANWTDVSNSNVVCANDNYISGVLEDISLPQAVEDQPLVYLRWVVASNTSVNNGTIASGGTSRINDILIRGESRGGGGDTTPPTISHTPASTAKPNSPIVITATINDASTVTAAVYYGNSSDRASITDYKMMTAAGNLFTATIGPQPQGELYYYIEAVDSEQNVSTAPKASEAVNLYKVILQENMSIAQAREAVIGTEVTVEGIVTTGSGYWGSKGFYIQDDTAGIYVFQNTYDVVAGDKVELTGELGIYTQELQLSNIKSLQKVDTEEVPEPIKVMPSQIDDRNAGKLVKLEGVTISSLTKVNNYGTIEFNATKNNESVLVRIDNRTGLVYDDFAFKNNDIVDVTGISSRYNNTIQLKPRGSQDIEAANLGSDETPPVINHMPIAQANKNIDLQIAAEITDNRNVAAATLYYRTTGTDPYKSIPMQLTDGKYVASIPKEELNLSGLDYYIVASDGTNETFSPSTGQGWYTVEIVDQDSFGPEITKLVPEHMSVLEDTNTKPRISAEYTDLSGVDLGSVKLMLDGIDVTEQSDVTDTVIAYTPLVDLKKGKHTIMLELADIYGNKTEKTWNFFIGQLEYNFYYGQLHSHTNFSDGQGTPEQAYTWARDNGKADFFAVTDHSNWFDKESDRSNETITDVSQSTSSEWKTLNELADTFTEDEKFVGIAGFEMTWSDGTGHINTFNTPWFASRSNSAMTLQAYYDKIKEWPESISQLNHPGKTFGDFKDFGYYSPDVDKVVQLIEVGNGEGPIRGSGYFPSYEYYTRALDKGWHVAPANNQDNHKGQWVTANEARTVVLAPSLSRENVYNAIRDLMVYSTEDKNLEISYKINGMPMGTILSDVNTLNFEIKIEDPDLDDAIGKVSIIADGGAVVASKIFDSNIAEWNFELDSEYAYYYVRVDQADRDIAVTAPIWTTEVVPVGLSKVEASQNPTIKGTQIELSATIYNNSSSAINNTKVEFYLNGLDGDKIGEAVVNAVPSGSEGIAIISWTPTAADTFRVYAKTSISYSGMNRTFTNSTRVNVLEPEEAVKVVIDGGHYNAYITGYYAGKYEGLKQSLSELGMVAFINNDKLTAEDLEGAKILILSDPESNINYNRSLLDVDEIDAVKGFVNGGGSLLITSRADYGEGSYPKEYQSSVQSNSVLEALGSNLRINDDQVIDNHNNDGLPYRLMFDQYVSTKYNLTQLADPSLKFRIYSGSSVILKEEGTDEKVDWLVKVHPTTVSDDADKSGDNTPVPAGEFHVLAAEVLDGGGKVAVGGCTFYSDFELTGDNLHANKFILENILGWMAEGDQSGTMAIKDVRKDSEGNNIPDLLGKKVKVEGYVTAESEAYTRTNDRNNAFFEVIYVQDETGGITVFGISKTEVPIGAKVSITGEVGQYLHDTQIRVTDEEKNVVVLDATPRSIKPVIMTTGDSMKEANEGWLVQIQGQVTRITGDALYLDDGSGEARVFVDGYIGDGTTNPDKLGKWDSSIQVGDFIRAIGLASEDTEGHRLRVRNTGEIVKVTSSSESKKITIVHTNDIHGRVEGGAAAAEPIGMAKIATKIKALKESNPGSVLVLDAGDTFHGQTIVSLSQGESMVKIMNLMGYDAMTAGNHDFNYGKERLKELDTLSDFPILGANVVNQSDGSHFLTPYMIKNVDGVRVAIFGLSTPETTYKTHPKNVEGLTFRDPVRVAQEMVDGLKDKADVIIALAHVGIDEGSEVTSIDIANAVTGIDLIIDGHSHSKLPNGYSVNGTLIVQTGEYDNNIGIVEMTVYEDLSKNISAKLYTKEEANAENLAEDEDIKALINKIKKDNDVITSVVVGHTDVELDGIRDHVRTGETNLGNLITDAMRDVANADVALTNGGGIRASIHVGEITKGEIITVLPFGNYVVLKEVKGSQLLAALEHGLSVYPASNGGFPHISGMKVVFNPSAAAGHRVIRITIGGEPIDLQKTYKLATNDFLGAGGDNYTMFVNDPIKGEFPALDEVVIDYIQKNGTSGAVIEGRIDTVKGFNGTKIAVLSDPHYFAPELGTAGGSFEAYLAQDRKLIAESSAIAKAAVSEIKNSDAQIVLIAGDLTKDGEELSHKQFAALIGQLQEAGKKVYVVPGNHDINNPAAYAYEGAKVIEVPNVSPEQFKTIYEDFGYKEALAWDPNSLSYVVEPVPGLWILAMDSCYYAENEGKSHSITAGGFSEERLNWIKEQLRQAKAQGKQVIGMMHHGILEHYTGQKQLFGEYVIDDWEAISTELADSGLSIVFTGHYHAQDIVKKVTPSGNYIFDIQTGSLVTYPVPYRMVELNQETMTINTNRIMNIDYNTGNKSFQQHAREFLVEGLKGLVPAILTNTLIQQGIPAEQAAAQAQQIAKSPIAEGMTLTIGELIVDAFVAHYSGDEKAQPQILSIISSMAQSNDSTTKLLGSTLWSLYNDPEPSDNSISIDLKTGTATNYIDRQAPGEVANLKIEQGNKQLKLTWQEPNDSDFMGVNIYQGNIFKQFVYQGTESIAITDLENGAQYVFTLKTLDFSGNESTGRQISGTPKAPSSSGGSSGSGNTGNTNPNETTVKSRDGAAIKNNDGVLLEIPPNAFQKDIKIKILKISDSEAGKLPIQNDFKLVSAVFEITKNETGDFQKRIRVTLPYEKSKVDMEKYDIAIYWLDEEKGEWIRLENIEMDTQNGKVSGEVNHFTKFAVISTLKEQKIAEQETIKEKPIELIDIKNHWAQAYIEALVQKERINGYPDQTFKPNNNITRAEFAAVIVKAFDLKVQEGTVFKDTQNHWAKQIIATASAYGIVSGYADGTFKPDEKITREQMAVMIVKAAKMNKEQNHEVFTDSNRISNWAKEGMDTIVNKGIIKGYPDKSIRPQGNATRAEAVTVIWNALNKQ